MTLETLLPDDIELLARQVIEANMAEGRKVAVAESCTGGLVSAALTEIPGSSAVFERGYVTYSNEAKMEELSVPLDIIETFGAVSIACAWAMAKGALAKSGADVAVAISGVAGPTGGTSLKPVGTVVFARVVKGEEGEPEGELKKFEPTSRADIRRQATVCALEMLKP
ncbi:CinA family protein [Qipengyuania sphaerica]|uniref:CinA family protein n=1 Tax=Qipengyuania sphaerica TaxID=2867243 RepID=UPI001C87C467|nr:CinA family protein [Qipengyuania sphaerica]MBX7540652.1 CinA family protein [Qipengyuania sphaerica]